MKYLRFIYNGSISMFKIRFFATKAERFTLDFLLEVLI